MSEAINLELARLMVAALDAHDERALDELIHPAYRDHAAFADTDPTRRIQVEDLIASGDRVVARVRVSAIHHVSTTQVHIWRVAEGRLAEHWMAGPEEAS